MKTILLGADHAGFKLKQAIKRWLLAEKWKVEDLSETLIEGDDYPLVAQEAAKKVANDSTQQAILVCGTGLGMDIAANRFHGVRAVVIRDAQEAKLAREHNHANILILGGRITSDGAMKKILDAWFKTAPSKASRHVRRVKQLDQVS